MALAFAYAFWKYFKEYRIFDEDGCIIGFRDNAPEEAKNSWEEYLKDLARWDEEGIK